MDNYDHIRYDLACHGLAMVARGMDLTTDRAWKALVECANCIAERHPEGGLHLDVLMEIERKVKG